MATPLHVEEPHPRARPSRASKQRRDARAHPEFAIPHQLLLGNGFGFSPAGFADLKAFDEPIAIFAVTDGDAGH